MKEKDKLVKILVMIILLILVDQIIKFYIENTNENIDILNGFVKFTYSQNTGGAFGIWQNSLLSIVITNIIVLGIIIRFITINFDKIDWETRICLSLILAGGTSNFLDRIFRGYVVDFIDFNQYISFPIFNLADICIVIGWILFAFLTIRYAVKEN